MKAMQKHELETVSGGLWQWRPSAPAPAPWGSPMDGEWQELLTPLPDQVEPPVIVCPPPWEDAYMSF
jgi:hypothetical protein